MPYNSKGRCNTGLLILFFFNYSFSKVAHSVSLSVWAVELTFLETWMLSRLHIGSVFAWNLHSVTLQPIDLFAFMLVITSNNIFILCCNHIIG